MRVPIIPSTQNKAVSTPLFESKRKANVKIQIFDPITLYVALQQNDLTSGLDAVGNPQRGLQLGQGIWDFLGFNGQLFGLCNAATEIEVQWWYV